MKRENKRNYRGEEAGFWNLHEVEIVPSETMYMQSDAACYGVVDVVLIEFNGHQSEIAE